MTDEQAITRDEAIRYARSAGFFFYICGLPALVPVLLAIVDLRARRDTTEAILWGATGLAIYSLYFFVGFNLRRLRPWVRLPAMVLAGVSALFVPYGTIFAFLVFINLSAVQDAGLWDTAHRPTGLLR